VANVRSYVHVGPLADHQARWHRGTSRWAPAHCRCRVPELGRCAVGTAL